jgi:hypothetical protein
MPRTECRGEAFHARFKDVENTDDRRFNTEARRFMLGSNDPGPERRGQAFHAWEALPYPLIPVLIPCPYPMGTPQSFPGTCEREPDSDRGTSGFRFLAVSTRRTTFTGEVSSASRIRNSVSSVGDFKSRSSWLMYGRDSPALNESCSWVIFARSRNRRNSPPNMGRKPSRRWTECRPTIIGTTRMTYSQNRRRDDVDREELFARLRLRIGFCRAAL